MTGLRVACLCADPGIPIDGTKGASVHFREMAAALRAQGAGVEMFVAAAKRPAPDGVHVVRPHRASGIDGELHLIAGGIAMSERIAASGPFDAVYERLSLFGAAGLSYAARHDVPLVVEVNAPLWEEAARYRSLELGRVARALCIETMARADCIATVSHGLARRLEAEGIAPARIRVMPNGVNVATFERAVPATRPARFGDRPVLAFVGSLKPWHGVELLLDAVEHHQDRLPHALWIVGDGPLRDRVAEAARRCPELIEFEGGVPHERVPAVLKAADVACAPYPASAPDYFCPLKVVEALAVGCPLVASRTTAVTSLLDGRQGACELHEPGDADSYLAAVERLLARAIDRHATVDPAFGWDHNARELIPHLSSRRADRPSSTARMES